MVWRVHTLAGSNGHPRVTGCIHYPHTALNTFRHGLATLSEPTFGNDRELNGEIGERWTYYSILLHPAIRTGFPVGLESLSVGQEK